VGAGTLSARVSRCMAGCRSPAQHRNPRAWITDSMSGRTVGVLSVALNAEDEGALPPEVATLIRRQLRADVEGAFTVCPLDGDNRTRLQMVCIETVCGLEVKSRDSAH
jgi:hypothetical protein